MTDINWEAARSLTREQFNAIFGNVKMDGPTEPHPKADRLWDENGQPKLKDPRFDRKPSPPPHNGPCHICGMYVPDDLGHGQAMCPPCRSRHLEVTQAQWQADLEQEWV